MAPKNKKKTGFYFYMKEMQEREAAKGRRITMADMPQIAHPIWQKMSLAEKEPYEELAQQHKNDPTLRGGKLASDGTRIEDNLREALEKERLENEMKQAIKNYCNVDCISEEQFKEFASRKLFYFISFNLMCCTETEYHPNEIGLVEYSIRNGIIREYHKLIHLGRIPTGYAGEAKRLSEQHEIDSFGERISERDLKKVFNDIMNFTNPDNSEEFPPLFCLEEKIEENYGCLNFLALRARQRNCFEIWNAVYLLLELRAGVGAFLSSITIAQDLLTKTSFNYHPSARCEFHEEKDNHNCALAYSKRLCYLLSDAVCLQFDIELTEQHIPAISSEVKQYTVIHTNESARFNKKNMNPPLRLDSRNSYYQGIETEDDQFSDLQSVVSSSVTSGHRQPASTCLSAQMARLGLNKTTASVPGHGIGRGQRR